MRRVPAARCRRQIARSCAERTKDIATRSTSSSRPSAASDGPSP
jgi:hypothetical protein